MQTFLPYADFVRTAECLDYRRLGKQRVEAYQILRVLQGKTTGWQHHPAVKMWRGYELALCVYGLIVCREWKSRGYVDNTAHYFSPTVLRRLPPSARNVPLPPWIGIGRFTMRTVPISFARTQPTIASSGRKSRTTCPTSGPICHYNLNNMHDYIVRPTYRNGTEVIICHTQVPQPKAELAMKLMAHFGSIACQQDGEDSSGRQKLRLQTPDELVVRCCQIADFAYEEFARLGWLKDIPLPTAPQVREGDKE